MITKSGAQQDWRSVSRRIARTILDAEAEGETAAARIQQVGILMVIQAYEGHAEALTASEIARLTGLSRPQVRKSILKLESIGLIKRTKVLNDEGRGKAMILSVKYTPRESRIIEQLDSLHT